MLPIRGLVHAIGRLLKERRRTSPGPIDDRKELTRNERDEAVRHGEIEAGAAAGTSTLDETAEHGNRREQAARQVSQLQVVRLSRLTRHRVIEDAGDRLVGEVVSRAVASWAVLTEAGDR